MKTNGWAFVFIGSLVCLFLILASASCKSGAGAVGTGAAVGGAIGGVPGAAAGAGLGFFGNKLVGGIVQDLEDSADRIVAGAQNRGNALVANAGDEARVAALNLRYVLNEQRELTFRDLNESEQRLILSVKDMVDAADRLGERAASLEELASLDLLEFTNRIRLLTRKTYFYVSSVQGATAIKSDVPHRITIRGVGFGFPTDKTLYRATAAINGVNLAPEALQHPQDHEVVIEIPPATLAPMFQEDKLATAKFTFASVISSMSNPSKAKRHEVTFNLILMPIYAGTLDVAETLVSKQLDGVTLTHALTHVTPNVSKGKEYYYYESWDCALDQRIINVRYQSVGPMRQWCYRYKTARPGDGKNSEEDPDFELSDNETKVHVYRRCTAASTTLTHYIDYQTLKPVYQSLQHPPRRVRFGETIPVRLSPANTQHEYKVTGKLATGHKIDFTHLTPTAGGPVKVLGSGVVQDAYEVTLRVDVP
jgi:hypothetical protein